MELEKVRKRVSVKADEGAEWTEMLEVVDTIIANKSYLTIAEAIKTERKANEAFLTAKRAEIADINVELADISKKVNAANEYLDSGYKKREAEIEKKLEDFKEVEKKRINTELETGRKELKDVWAEITEAKTELEETKAKLRDLQKEISEMLVN